MIKRYPTILFFLIIVFILLTAYVLLNSNKPKYQQPYYQSTPAKSSPVVQKKDTITPLINSEVSKLSGTYSIYIKNLKSGEVYKINETKKLQAASIYKLAVMYKTYDSISKNQLSKSDILTQSKVTLDKKITDENQVEQSNSQVVSNTVENALNLMITVSDNYSAILLAEKLGWKNIDILMESLNFNAIDLIETDSPTINAQDIGKLLENIYLKKAVSNEASQEMLALLLGQKMNDRIPKYLPVDIKVAHKTGELDLVRHDVGIVFGKKSDYIFVFLTQTNNQPQAAESVAVLSKKIYDELEK